MNDVYFFVDGSAFLGDVKRLQDRSPELRGKRVVLSRIADQFISETTRRGFVGAYRRFVYYFADGDSRVETLVALPAFSVPGEVTDLGVTMCGKRLDAKLRDAERWLDENNAPQWVRERLGRTEKAVDTQMCCDALQLAAVKRIDRLCLYTNDYDFVPLCRTMRHLGINVNLLRLTEHAVNEELVKEVDGFTVIRSDQISSMFVEAPQPSNS
jgi:uncharacterized LabA/DUF88 family protein